MEILPFVPTGTIEKLAIVSFAIRLLTADVDTSSEVASPNGNDFSQLGAIGSVIVRLMATALTASGSTPAAAMTAGVSGSSESVSPSPSRVTPKPGYRVSSTRSGDIAT